MWHEARGKRLSICRLLAQAYLIAGRVLTLSGLDRVLARVARRGINKDLTPNRLMAAARASSKKLLGSRLITSN
jgi:hypothetical protein